jgi:chitodextrinase
VSLFTEVTIEEWPEFVQPISAETAYHIGDQVTFNGIHYKCIIDNCTWSPSDYPSAWEE